MHGAIRAGLTVAAATLLVAATAPAAGAAPAAPSTSQPQTSGAGPDDLLSYAAEDLAPDTATTVGLDGVGTSYHADLPTQTTDADGDLVAAATQRTPADLTPGSYTITFTQPGSDGGDDVTLTTPAFPIVAPALRLSATALHPGDPLTLELTGLGAGPQVHRTVTVDGVQVASTSAEDADSVREALVVPTWVKPGAHTVALAQDVHPTATVSASFTVVTPSLRVSVAATSTRGSFTVTGADFGIGDALAISVRDADGDQYALTTVAGQAFAVRAYLPGIGSGTATVVATSGHNRATASATLSVAASLLRSPRGLAAGGQLRGPHGYSTFSMQSDGNLVLYVLGRARWSSGTAGHPGARLAVQSDGNLVIYSRTGAALWTPHTTTPDTPVELVAQDDGNVVLYDSAGLARWSTRTAGPPATLLPGQTLAPGDRLTGPGQVRLVMQTDGNAVLTGRSGTVVWSTRTAGNPNAALTLQTDGNLVVYGQDGRALFANRALVGAGARLVAQSDGNLVEYAASGKAVWSSGTAGR